MYLLDLLLKIGPSMLEHYLLHIFVIYRVERNMGFRHDFRFFHDQSAPQICSCLSAMTPISSKNREMRDRLAVYANARSFQLQFIYICDI